MEFQQVIARTRDLVRQSQASYSERNWQADRIRKLLIQYLVDHRFDAQFRDQRLLLERGRVVWGAIIQANSNLYRPGPTPLPAVLMYSEGESYDAHPALLGKHAHSLFDLKGKTCTPEMQAFGDKLANERVADIKLPIPLGFTDGIQCYYATLMIGRQQLPGQRLVRGFLPVLIAPSESDAVIVSPKAYWDPQLKVAWSDRTG